MNNTDYGSQPIKNEQSGTKELSFEVLKDAILKYKAKSQYIQASIIILRDIFEDDTIQGANFAKQPIANEWVKVEDVKKYLTEQEKHSLEMCKVAKDNRDIFLEGISTGECVAFSLVSAFLTHLKNKI